MFDRESFLVISLNNILETFQALNSLSTLRYQYMNRIYDMFFHPMCSIYCFRKHNMI